MPQTGGMPVQPSAPPYPGASSPMPPGPLPPKSFPMESLLLITGVLFGVLIFVGLFAYHAILLTPSPTAAPYYPPPSTDPTVVAYRDLIRNLAWISTAAMDAAVAFSVTLAFVLGVTKSNVADTMRRGLFIFAAAFLIAWIFLSQILLSALSYRFAYP